MPEAELLGKVGCSQNVIDHCFAVSESALEIAASVSIPVDMQLVRKGALLHDIGRCRSHGIDHAVIGAALARETGLDEKIALIIERHIGSGISVEEAERLGLPARDYIPVTPEEKIVSYADSLTLGTKKVTFEEALERFSKELGNDHEAVNGLVHLHEEVTSWIKRGSL